MAACMFPFDSPAPRLDFKERMDGVQLEDIYVCPVHNQCMYWIDNDKAVFLI